MRAVGPEWMLPSSSTGEQYSSPLFSSGLKMFLKDSASVRPRTDSGRADRKAKCTPACKACVQHASTYNRIVRLQSYMLLAMELVQATSVLKQFNAK